MTAKPQATPPRASAPAITVDTQPDREARNPFFRWSMHVGLPLALALVFHVSVLATAALVRFAVVTTPAIEVGEYEASLHDVDVSGGFTFDETPTFDTSEDIQSLDDLQFSEISPTDLTIDDATDISDFGSGDFGLGSGEGGGILGLGGGAGEAGSGGLGSGLGQRMRIGSAGVWNLNVAANRIIYVVDFSGSIITVDEDLKRELKRSVGRLRPSQSFNVILFYGERRAVADPFAPALVPANGENKARFIEWIRAKAPQGRTEPLAAVERALKQQPEAIFFFSDGRFESSVVDEITSLNQRANAQIVCLLFDEAVFEDTSGLPPGINDQAQRLRNLAEQNKGRGKKAAFKIVTLKDL